MSVYWSRYASRLRVWIGSPITKSLLLDERLGPGDAAETFVAVRERLADAGLRASNLDVYFGASELQLTVVAAVPGVKRAEDWIALGRKQFSDHIGLDPGLHRLSFSFLAGGRYALFAASPRECVDAMIAAMKEGKHTHTLATARAFPTVVASELAGRHRSADGLVLVEPGAVTAFSQLGDTRSADVMHIVDSADGQMRELSRRRLALAAGNDVRLCRFDLQPGPSSVRRRPHRPDWLDCLAESAL